MLGGKVYRRRHKPGPHVETCTAPKIPLVTSSILTLPMLDSGGPAAEFLDSAWAIPCRRTLLAVACRLQQQRAE